VVGAPSAWVLLGLPLLFTLFVWWFSTGIILYLDGLPRSTFRLSLGVAAALTVVALYLITVTSQQTDRVATYAGFAGAIIVWGWLEMAFLMGFITGPRTTACPAGSVGWRRASFAISAIFYHELALLVGGGAIALLTWNSPNHIAAWTFVVLWISRQSTKLNLFLGVRNFSEEFLPEHLRYIESYFTRRPMNLLFPISVSIGSVVAVMLWQNAAAADADVSVGFAFLATLVTLALLEHWFLILPINFAALWQWSLGSRRGAPVQIAEKASS
jgi:putative photosynthetic complex assembly protein 2